MRIDGLSEDCWDDSHDSCEDELCGCICHDDGDDDGPEWPPGIVVADTRGLT